MSIKNTSTTYGSIAKFFHWTIAAIVILMLCFGPFMDDITSKAIRSPVITFHKLTGLAILLLVVLRLLWTLYNPKPQLPINASRWEIMAERVVHLMLYLLLLGIPISGWIKATAGGKPPHFFNFFSIPMPGIPFDKSLSHFASEMHTLLAITLAIFISIHIGAAIKHHVSNKDDVLKRMMPGT